MMARFNAVTFSVIFAVAYAVAFWFELPAFKYYAVPKVFVWGGTTLADSGPPIVWYGLMATAAIPGAVLAFILPNRLIDGVFRNYLWLFPVLTSALCLYLLRIFFLR